MVHEEVELHHHSSPRLFIMISDVINEVIQEVTPCAMLFANDLFLSDETTEKTAGEDSWRMQIGKSVGQKRKIAAAAKDHNEGV